MLNGMECLDAIEEIRYKGNVFGNMSAEAIKKLGVRKTTI